MTPTAAALLGFVAWTIFLVIALAFYRTSLVMSGKRRANSFNPSGADVEGFGLRLTRAHANCYENLPVAGAVLLYAIATGQTAATDPFAYAFITARVLQSVVHLLSTSPTAVTARFALYLVQLAILVFWLAKLSGLL